MDSPYITVLELADLLRVPRSRVYEWTRERGPDAIPSYRAGKRLVFDSEEVMAWFKRTQRRDSMLLTRDQHRRTLLRARGSRFPERVVVMREDST